MAICITFGTQGTLHPFKQSGDTMIKPLSPLYAYSRRRRVRNVANEPFTNDSFQNLRRALRDMKMSLHNAIIVSLARV